MGKSVGTQVLHFPVHLEWELENRGNNFQKGGRKKFGVIIVTIIIIIGNIILL